MTQLTWSLANARVHTLDRPHLMGIVNITPDSFSEAGKYLSAEAAADHALQLVPPLVER